MAALCMSDDLVAEYLSFRFGSKFNKDLIAKLLRFIQPALVASNQHSLFQDPSILNQLASDPIIRLVPAISAANTMENLVKQTALKLQLVTTKQRSCDYTQLNISPISANFENLSMLLAGTFETGQHKQEALEHIKDLIADAQFVKITDRYVAKNNHDWRQCKGVLDCILPKKELSPLKIITINFNRHKELTSICSDWKISGEQIDRNVHDRYIESDKVKIMLSSGIFHLSTSSNTDLTYTVKIK